VSISHLLKLCGVLGIDEDLNGPLAMTTNANAPVGTEVAALPDWRHVSEIDWVGICGFDRYQAGLIEKELSSGEREVVIG